MSQKQRLKNHLVSALKLGFAVGLIYWLVRSGRLDLDQLARLFSPGFVILGLLVILANIFFNTIRWFWLLRGQDFPIPFSEALRLTFIGLFFNLVVPGGVGGDLIKGYYLVKDHPKRKMAAAMTILMDRILGLVGMIVLCLISIIMNIHFVMERPDLRPMLFGLLALCLGFLTFFGTALSRNMHRSFQGLWRRLPMAGSFQKLHDAVHDYRRNLKVLVRCVVISVFSQTFTILLFYMTGRAMGMQDVPWQAYFFVVPLGLMILAVPIAPAGIGVGQVAFYVLFNKYLGYESQLGSTAISSFQILNILWAVVGAFFYFQRRKVIPVETLLDGESSDLA